MGRMASKFHGECLTRVSFGIAASAWFPCGPKFTLRLLWAQGSVFGILLLSVFGCLFVQLSVAPCHILQQIAIWISAPRSLSLFFFCSSPRTSLGRQHVL